MRAYYHARAREYDDWWLGHGLFADRERPGWDDEVVELTAAIEALPPARTLDVACGTGFLTRHLPGEVTGLDQSDEMVSIASEQVPAGAFVVGDALELPFPDASFERVFSSFFYCHLEEPERVRFLGEARRVAPELVIVGGAGGPSEDWEERMLEDGTRWEVYKRRFEPAQLAAELGGEIVHAGRWFVAVRAA